MRLQKLFSAAGLECPEEAKNINVKNIVTDSRKVVKDSLFLCIRGLHSDGHDHIDSAIRAGASVIVAEKVRDACVGGAAAIILLDNTRSVAAKLYNALYGDPVKKLKIIGVTGTNGKTSTCFMLYEIFRRAGYTVGLMGTVCRISADGKVLTPKKHDPTAAMTTPDPDELYRTLAKMAKDGVEYVFMEVSSHALSQGRVEAIDFDGAVFTNLSRDHLDFHGSMEEYYKAKSELFHRSRHALINVGGDFGKRLAAKCPCPFFTCSVTEGDFYAFGQSFRGLCGVSYILKSPYGDIEINSPLLGDFAIENSLMAASLALMYGIPKTTVAEALSNTRGVSGRMERLDTGEDEPSVIIDYAHTPDALERLLKSVHRLRTDRGHIILIFGCGGDRDRGKRPEMARIASRYADMTIITSDNCRGESPEQIFSDILKGIDKERPYTVIKDRRAAIESAVMTASARDIIVLAGKGHEKYELDGRGRHFFDESRIVRTALKRRYY